LWRPNHHSGFNGRDVTLLIWPLVNLLPRVEKTLPQYPGLALAVAQPRLTSSQVLDTFPVEQSIAPGSENFLLDRNLEAREADFPYEQSDGYVEFHLTHRDLERGMNAAGALTGAFGPVRRLSNRSRREGDPASSDPKVMSATLKSAHGYWYYCRASTGLASGFRRSLTKQAARTGRPGKRLQSI
jgi:hypothetical protein